MKNFENGERVRQWRSTRPGTNRSPHLEFGLLAVGGFQLRLTLDDVEVVARTVNSRAAVPPAKPPPTITTSERDLVVPTTASLPVV